MAVDKVYRELTSRIRYHEKINPSEWVAKSQGLNFKKIANQIKMLKEKGYSYSDQLYALDYLVSYSNNTFYGYTHLVNNIDWIMEKKRQNDKKIEQVQNAKNEPTQERIYDLTSMIESGDDW